MGDVRVVVNGEAFGGWSEAYIERGLEQMAATFQLSITEKWPHHPLARPIHAGDECQIFVDDDLEMRGYVDDVFVDYDATQHRVSIMGRDKTADLIDSSAMATEFKNYTLLQIAKRLCEPHGVNVTAVVDVGEAFKKFAIEPGATVFDVIERAARNRALLMVANSGGDLVLTRTSKAGAAAPIKLGDNVLSLRSQVSRRERFHKITVRGQTPGDDNFFGSAASGAQASATDNNVRSNRETLLITETADANLKSRALWEAAVRFGRSRWYEYTVQGWRGNNGELWQPNTITEVDDIAAGLRTDMLITNVRRKINSAGTVTDLKLMSPQAFALLPVPEETQANAIFN